MSFLMVVLHVLQTISIPNRFTVFAFLYIQLNSNTIKEAVNALSMNIDDPTDLQLFNLLFGKINHWDTSSITSMKSMFRDWRGFNEDISGWDTENVNNMANMFSHCNRFNQPIGRWNVSNVTDMSAMFIFAYSFNCDLSSWNPVQLKRADFMFYGAHQFRQLIESWNVSSLKHTIGMFDIHYGNWLNSENKVLPGMLSLKKRLFAR